MSFRTQRSLGSQPNAGDFDANTLVMADSALAGGFVQLPKTILYATNLSRDAKFLYAILLGYAWQEARCFPGYGRLCQDMQASENMVRKYMTELQAIDLLTQRRRGLGKTNIYTLCDIRTSKIEVLEPSKSAVQEPAKTEVYKETEQKQTDEYLSKSRTTAIVGSERRAMQRDSGTVSTRLMTRPGFAKLDSVLRDRVKSRKAPVPVEERQAIGVYVHGYSQRFQDKASAKSSTSRACNLYRQAKGRHPWLGLSVFLGKLEEAASVTADCHDRVRSTSMGYYFSVVEDLLGVKAQRNAPDFPSPKPPLGSPLVPPKSPTTRFSPTNSPFALSGSDGP